MSIAKLSKRKQTQTAGYRGPGLAPDRCSAPAGHRSSCLPAGEQPPGATGTRTPGGQAQHPLPPSRGHASAQPTALKGRGGQGRRLEEGCCQHHPSHAPRSGEDALGAQSVSNAIVHHLAQLESNNCKETDSVSPQNAKSLTAHWHVLELAWIRSYS